MPDLDGIAASRELLSTFPALRVVMLTTFEQADYIFGALKAGASGFLLKRSPPEKLLAAIHTIAGGNALLSAAVTSRVIERAARQTPADPSLDERIADVTERERDVLELVASGLWNSEIASQLAIDDSRSKPTYDGSSESSAPAIAYMP